MVDSTPTPAKLDELVDTDPLVLRDHAIRFRARLVEAEAEREEAVRLLGEVADWCGTSEWSGPQLPSDVARRMAAALNKEGQ